MKAKFFLSLSFMLSLFIVQPLEAASISSDPVGTYDFVVSDIPDQPDVKGTMVVSKDSGSIKVQFSSDAGEIVLNDAKLDGNQLTGKIEVQGVILKLDGKFTADGFEGQWNSEFGALGIMATKK